MGKISIFKIVWVTLKQLVLPKYCFGCGLAGILLCAQCKAVFYQLPREKSDFMAEIAGKKQIWVLGEYNGLLKRLILVIKHSKIPGWDLLSWEIGYCFLRHLQLHNTELATQNDFLTLVVPAPSATRAIGERPVYWFAKGIVAAMNSSNLSPAVLWDGLILDSKSGKQAGKNALERGKNRYGKMCLAQLIPDYECGQSRGNIGEFLDKGRIIICDDVVATGATLNEMVRVINSNGGEVSAVFCLAYVKNLLKKDVG